MNDVPNYAFEYVFRDGNRLAFQTFQQVAEWAEAERNKWQWLSSESLKADAYLTKTRGVLNTLRLIVREANNQLKNRESGHTVVPGMMEPHFQDLDKRGLYPGSLLGERIAQIRAKEGELAAANVLAAFDDGSYSERPDISPPYVKLRGVVERVLLERGASLDAVSAWDAAVSQTQDRINAVHDRQSQKVEELINLMMNRSMAFDVAYAQKTTELNALLTNQGSKLDQHLTDSIGKLEGIAAAYNEHMNLQAPVEYWTAQSKLHGLRQAIAFRWLIGIATLGAILIAGAFLFVLQALRQTAAGLSFDHFVLSAIAVVTTTIVFWTARIVLRITLSERHLKNESEERSTMIKTYLALTREKEATKDDRHIILSAIFHPFSDGIVKDDAAPDLSFASWISKLAAK